MRYKTNMDRGSFLSCSHIHDTSDKSSLPSHRSSSTLYKALTSAARAYPRSVSEEEINSCTKHLNSRSIRRRPHGHASTRAVHGISSQFYQTAPIVLVVFVTNFSQVSAQDTTNANSSNAPQALIIVGCIIAFIVAGLLIAKCVEYCHDRKTISDSASDVSEYTRELLKSQMMLMMFNRSRRAGRNKLKPEECAIKFAKVWRAKVARNRARRIKRERSGLVSPTPFRKQTPQTIQSKSKSSIETPITLAITNETAKAQSNAQVNGRVKNGGVITPPVSQSPTLSTEDSKKPARPKSAKTAPDPGGQSLKRS